MPVIAGAEVDAGCMRDAVTIGMPYGKYLPGGP